VEKKDQSLMLTPAEVLVKRLAGVIKTSKPLKDEELEKMIFQSKVKYFRDKYKKNK